MAGLRFAERRYHAEHLPSNIFRLYQLLLELIRARSVLAVSIARSMRCGWNIIDQVLTTGYVKIVTRPCELSESMRDKIVEMKGEVPRWIYA
jgi:hypothetical protein